MSALSTSTYPPQQVLWDLDRLAVLDPLGEVAAGAIAESARADWEEAHRLVRRSLSNLARRVQRDHPWIRARCGKTSSGERWLFSYCEFDVPEDHGIDGIGVGVSIDRTADGRIAVKGDIVRDETGEILFELEDLVVTDQRLEVTAATQEAARRLSTQVDCVVDGLQQPCWPGSPACGC